jgi:hypothetical protein
MAIRTDGFCAGHGNGARVRADGALTARARAAQVEKRLKALPDFGSAGVWADDDAVEVPESFAPLKDVNGAEAKFLLRFLFKRAAMFRESDVKAATQARSPALPPLSPFQDAPNDAPFPTILHPLLPFDARTAPFPCLREVCAVARGSFRRTHPPRPCGAAALTWFRAAPGSAGAHHSSSCSGRRSRSTGGSGTTRWGRCGGRSCPSSSGAPTCRRTTRAAASCSTPRCVRTMRPWPAI